jgi:hypothetical protein
MHKQAEELLGRILSPWTKSPFVGIVSEGLFEAENVSGSGMK